MAYERVCAVADLAVGDMAAFYLEGEEVLVLRDKDGDLQAVDGICPHEDYPLVEGLFDGTTLTCVNHLWCFDVTTGRGVNPPTSCLTRFPVKADGDDVYVDPDAGER
jgi:toluene monooxygenase system ferredoxin subunit